MIDIPYKVSTDRVRDIPYDCHDNGEKLSRGVADMLYTGICTR